MRTDQGKFNPSIAAKELPMPNTKNTGIDKNNKIMARTKAKTNISAPLT
ncbi:MAG: hypothetical protein O3A90_12745 [Proteobacteria bacterium]|nr:hypothetical protein [Pseudomonadota bacterium]MDA0849694.1 hypothetical protein [Pseudomonadota bacterium]MDA1295981.1 hypothetical protein [Pseudomonadota bacterium]